MKILDLRQPKLCSAPVGSVVQVDDKIYLVCAFNPGGKRAARPNMSQGLYDDERDLFLVEMATGEAVKMPHLSSRVDILHTAVLTLGEASPTSAHGGFRYILPKYSAGSRYP